MVVPIQGRELWRALQNTAINILIPLNAREMLTSGKTVSFSIRNLFHGLIISFNFVTSFEEILKPIF